MYEVINIAIDNYLAVIYSTSCDSPMNSLSQLEDDLKKLKIKGEVLFDLLLSNGHNSERFYKAFFTGKEFKVNTLAPVDSPSVQIQQASLEFYHSRPSYLSQSVLPKPLKFLIKKKALRTL